MSSFAIYKPNQGYWTRVMSGLGLALLVLMGVAWIVKLLQTVKIFGMEPVVGQAVVSVIILTVTGWIGYTLIAVKPRMVEFMIAVESEMKKVNWSTKREIIGSTWVVIGLTIFLALLCFFFDSLYQFLFTKAGVLAS